MKTTVKSLALAFAAGCGVALTSCEDMLTKESDYYIYADQDHLNSAADTVNSVLGILNKLQNIAVRANLLGEVRADLVSLNSVADINLRELSSCEVSDDNKYNSPGDYYAVINNCNYFIAKADANLANVAKDTIFRKEIDAVRVYRAWTYLQLALSYGSVPLVDEPILSEAEAEAWEAKPRKSLLEVCDYFINDLAANYKSDEFPNYGNINDNVNPLLVFLPRLVVLGDLYLWRNALTGDETDARNAALCYYKWISNTSVPGRRKYLESKANVSMWSDRYHQTGEYLSPSGSTTYSKVNQYGGENITCIPMDSASNLSNYNQLRVLYNSRADNNYEAAISPSKAYVQISRSQAYCGYIKEQHLAVYPTNDQISDLYGYKDIAEGDLRYSTGVSQSTGRMAVVDENNNVTIINVDNYQRVSKMNADAICLYRVGALYLRLAEALNAAGFPAFSQTILTWGTSDYSIQNTVLPYCTTAADSAFVNTFSFPNTECKVYEQPAVADGDVNMIGIHSRGSGDTQYNERYYHSAYLDAPLYQPYVMSEADSAYWIENRPNDFRVCIDSVCVAKDAELMPLFHDNVVKPYYVSVKEAEQNAVDSLLQIEWALEEVFDGTRFYNLMRADYRKRKTGLGWTDNPLSVAVSRRDEAVGAKLKDENNWFISWQGKIGR